MKMRILCIFFSMAPEQKTGVYIIKKFAINKFCIY